MCSFNLNGQCYQQILYEYEADNKPKPPKVVNVDPRAAPSIRPGVIDLTQNTPAPGQFAPQGGAAMPVSYSPGTQQPAPAAEAPKKKSFFGRLFGGKEKK